MSLYLLLSFIWLTLGASVAAVLIAWPNIGSTVRLACYPLMMITLIFLVLYVAPVKTSFLGLEYDDAFEYAYAGSVLGQQPATRSFDLNPVCVDGTVRECASYATLPHPIGLSTLLSWPDRLLRPSLVYGSIVSLVFMWVASIGVFILLRLWSVRTPYAIFGSLLFMSTPVCLALGGTSLAEPTAAGLVVLALVLTEALRRRPAAYHGSPAERLLQFALASAVFSALTLAIFTKRESLALVAILALACLIRAIVETSGGRATPTVHTAIILAACVGVLALCLAVGSGGLLNWDAIRPTSGAPFSFNNFERFGGNYFAHLFSLRFLLLAPLAIVGTVSLVHNRRPAILVPIVVGYMVVFASFSQDYYAQVAGEIPYYHFERYTVEIAPLLAALGAVGVQTAGGWAGTYLGKRPVENGVVVLGLLLVGLGGAVAFPFRSSLAVEEANLRRDPVRRVCPHVPSRGWVISTQPILFFVYCDRPVHVIASEALGAPSALSGSLPQLRDAGLLYLWQANDEQRLDTNRFTALARFLRGVRRERVFQTSNSMTSFGLYRLRRA